MMYFRFFQIDSAIEFSDDYINVLEIENKVLFKKIVYLINRFSNYKDESDEVILVEGEAKLDISQNVLVINDFYNIDINTNKILKMLYQDIEDQYKFEFGEEDIIFKSEKLLQNIQSILLNYDFNFEYKIGITISELLKVMGLKFNKEYYDNPFENLLCLFDLIATLKLYKVVVLVNAKTFLNEEELIEIYKGSKYRNINLLIIEHNSDKNLKMYEKKLIIDDDFDEFVQ